MNINLSEEHQQWLNERVAAGEFSSPEDAMCRILDQRMFEDDDMAWAKPLVDEALANLERGGKCYTLEEHKAHMDAHMDELRLKYRE